MIKVIEVPVLGAAITRSLAAKIAHDCCDEPDHRLTVKCRTCDEDGLRLLVMANEGRLLCACESCDKIVAEFVLGEVPS